MRLSPDQIERFVADGFVKLEGAFSRQTAAACREILWRDLKLSPERPDGWTEPVLRLGMYADPPFREAASSPVLKEALNQLVGGERWVPFQALGQMVVRFPSDKAPWDDGWHIDGSFPPNDDFTSTDWIQWRVNFVSRGRAMLMLFLFSDCGEDDAPTRVRIGSHLPMARQLAAHGDAGISLEDLAREGFESSANCDVRLATGEAGTVWLLHPFLVHAAQAHRGRTPRFLAQPGLGPRAPLQIEGDGAFSPVERAIRLALGC
ncbi:MAG TPA: hypothetical protein VFV70_05935 [Hyphomonadaceae bacterium]|nr:hypothetical protein [Hyphomonadaceae bacterium]